MKTNATTNDESEVPKCPECTSEADYIAVPSFGIQFHGCGKNFKEKIEKENKPIDKFDGEFRWLSNFYHCDVTYEGQSYKSSEGAYQAAKTLDPIERSKFENVSAGMSKKMGKKLKLRLDWEEVKDNVMREIIKCKFEQNPNLMTNLINTGNRELVEGNYWGDTYWGVCRGVGKNMLGKLLMELREQSRNNEKQ